MLKKAFLTFIMLLTITSLVFAENYAVLISGETPSGDAKGKEKNWNGGVHYPGGSDEFWNDTFLMWETLWQLGWKDENIFVLFGNNADWITTNDNYRANQHNLPPWNINHITDYGANLADVENIFNWLADGNSDELIPQMTNEDILFVWTHSHGRTDLPDITSLLLMDCWITDEYFATLVDQIVCDKRVFLMQQCASGGFIDNLQNNLNTVVLTSTIAGWLAWRADDTDPDGDPPDNVDSFENEFYPTENDFYHHGEFNYHVMNAARLKTVAYENPNLLADLNSDGKASIYEIKEWNLSRNSQSETPQYSDPQNLGTDLFFDIPPSAPINLSIGVDRSHPTPRHSLLYWDASTHPDVEEYEIYRQVNHTGGYSVIGTTSETFYVDPDYYPTSWGLEGGSIHHVAYKIKAVDNTEQSSDFSSSVSDLLSTVPDVVPPPKKAIPVNAETLPTVTELLPSFPNPFNAMTELRFSLSKAANVRYTVFDILGRKIMEGRLDQYKQGYHTHILDMSDMTAGVYFTQVQIGEYTSTQKIVLLK